jgi:hypothetical protein
LFGTKVRIYLFIHIQIQGVTLKCEPGKVYSGFCRTNKHKSNQTEAEFHSQPDVVVGALSLSSHKSARERRDNDIDLEDDSNSRVRIGLVTTVTF